MGFIIFYAVCIICCACLLGHAIYNIIKYHRVGRPDLAAGFCFIGYLQAIFTIVFITFLLGDLGVLL